MWEVEYRARLLAELKVPTAFFAAGITLNQLSQRYPDMFQSGSSLIASSKIQPVRFPLNSLSLLQK